MRFNDAEEENNYWKKFKRKKFSTADKKKIFFEKISKKFKLSIYKLRPLNLKWVSFTTFPSPFSSDRINMDIV